MEKRNSSIDIFKGLLIFGMIYTHVLQFYCDTLIFPTASVIVEFFNIITFSGFMFCFGYASQNAYFEKDMGSVHIKMLKSGLKPLAAFYISGIYFRTFIDGDQLSWESVSKILILQDIPGWSEFLASFFLVSMIALLFFKWIKVTVNNKSLFWTVFALLLLTTFIPYEKVTINQVGLLIGTKKFASFSVLQYMPLYLLGAYFCKYKITYDFKMLLGAAASTSASVIYYVVQDFKLPSRFPPSIFWILSSMFFLYLYYLLSRTMDKEYIPTGFIQLLGKNVLFYLLMSNILIFTFKNAHKHTILSAAQSLGITIVIIIIISFLLGITNRNTTEKAAIKFNLSNFFNSKKDVVSN